MSGRYWVLKVKSADELQEALDKHPEWEVVTMTLAYTGDYWEYYTVVLRLGAEQPGAPLTTDNSNYRT